MRYAFLIFFFLPVFLFSQTFRKKYKGTIGPYPITITLVSKKGNLTGTYYYDSFDDPISIRGFVTGKSIRFFGYDLKGNMIDQFVGNVNKYDISGIWIGEGMQKRYPFSLREIYTPPPPLTRLITVERILLGLAGIVFIAAISIYVYIRRKKSVPKFIRRIELLYMRLFAPHRIGYQFERFITDRLDPAKYRLIEWRNLPHKKFKLSTYSPGLIFEQKSVDGERYRFGISCRFYPALDGDKVSLSRELTQFENDKDVFVAVGIGGIPSAPESVYLIPIDRVKENIVSLKDISRFKIQGATVDYDPVYKTMG